MVSKKLTFFGFFILHQYKVWLKLIHHYIWWVFIRKEIMYDEVLLFKFEAVQIEEDRLQILLFDTIIPIFFSSLNIVLFFRWIQVPYL